MLEPGRKFDVTYLSVDQLKSRLDLNPASVLTNALTEVMLVVATARLVPEDFNLNALLPQVKPATLEEYLRKWWGKVDE